MTRASWDTHFLRLAHVNAERSTCNRAKVGAVLVRDHHQLTAGYNGSPSKLAHCEDVGCLVVDDRCQRTVHAGANAIIQAALHSVSTVCATLYVTHHPCLACCKMLINAGVIRIVYAEAYRVSGLAEQFLKEAGVKVEQHLQEARYEQ